MYSIKNLLLIISVLCIGSDIYAMNSSSKSSKVNQLLARSASSLIPSRRPVAAKVPAYPRFPGYINHVNSEIEAASLIFQKMSPDYWQKTSESTERTSKSIPTFKAQLENDTTMLADISKLFNVVMFECFQLYELILDTIQLRGLQDHTAFKELLKLDANRKQIISGMHARWQRLLDCTTQDEKWNSLLNLMEYVQANNALINFKTLMSEVAISLGGKAPVAEKSLERAEASELERRQKKLRKELDAQYEMLKIMAAQNEEKERKEREAIEKDSLERKQRDMEYIRAAAERRAAHEKAMQELNAKLQSERSARLKAEDQATKIRAERQRAEREKQDLAQRLIEEQQYGRELDSLGRKQNQDIEQLHRYRQTKLAQAKAEQDALFAQVRAEQAAAHAKRQAEEKAYRAQTAAAYAKATQADTAAPRKSIASAHSTRDVTSNSGTRRPAIASAKKDHPAAGGGSRVQLRDGAKRPQPAQPSAHATRVGSRTQHSAPAPATRRAAVGTKSAIRPDRGMINRIGSNLQKFHALSNEVAVLKATQFYEDFLALTSLFEKYSQAFKQEFERCERDLLTLAQSDNGATAIADIIERLPTMSSLDLQTIDRLLTKVMTD